MCSSSLLHLPLPSTLTNFPPGLNPPRSQLSPTKGVMDAGQRAMLQLAARTGKAVPATAGAASPVAVAAPAYTASQPSSATSSLAATLADLQVSSRQSSASDLGDRSRILAGLPPGLAAVHTRRASVGSDDPATPSSPADSVCSPQLVGAIRSFDTVVLRTLTPIKTRSRAGTEHGGGSDSSELPPSPPAPFADRLVSPFHEGHPGLKPKMAPGRPVVYHTRGASSGGLPAAPGAYNPYDLTMAALSSGGLLPLKLISCGLQPALFGKGACSGSLASLLGVPWLAGIACAT